VALIGVRGVGRHHAAWWHREGAAVCAVAGTSADTLAQSEEALRSIFDYTGQGYTDVSTMIAEAQPDIVDVCSPHAVHGRHVRTALESGCDVLCEKPFLWSDEGPYGDLLADAQSLVALAAERSCVLAVCTQFSAGARTVMDHWREVRGAESIRSFCGTITTPMNSRSANPFRVWADLSPHPISVLNYVLPGAGIDCATLRTQFDGTMAKACFDVTGPVGAVSCVITTENSADSNGRVRRATLNDADFTFDSFLGSDGVYQARTTTPWGDVTEEDYMQQVIKAFLANKPLVAGRGCLDHLEMMVRIADGARIQTEGAE
jgi:predicted dehydrogenase